MPLDGWQLVIKDLFDRCAAAMAITLLALSHLACWLNIRKRLPLLSIRATVVPLSAPGSVRTMCSLAASGFRV